MKMRQGCSGRENVRPYRPGLRQPEPPDVMGNRQKLEKKGHPPAEALPPATYHGRGYRNGRLCHSGLPDAATCRTDWYGHFGRHDERRTGKSKTGWDWTSRFLCKEDCTALSFPDNRFDAITVAFGIRNFEHLDLGLKEMYRVLVPGGHLVILELSEPEHFPMKQGYAVYSKVVIPALGRLLSKDRSAYTYLPESIKAFPQGEIMQEIIRKAGFSQVEFKRLTMGTCTLYFATK